MESCHDERKTFHLLLFSRQSGYQVREISGKNSELWKNIVMYVQYAIKHIIIIMHASTAQVCNRGNLPYLHFIFVRSKYFV